MRPILFFLISISVWSGNAFAISEAERHELQRIANELKVIQEMVIESETRKTPGSVEPFLYHALLGDLNVMIGGIEQKINQRYDATYQRKTLFVENNERY
jgi:RAQPRD family integrative conjugative element protein